MGRQICFFATLIDLQLILEQVFAKQLSLIDKYGNKQSFEESVNTFADFSKKILPNYYIVTDKSRVVKYKNSLVVDPIISDIIEIAACHLSYVDPNSSESLQGTNNRYEHGRFWYETSYYDDNGFLVKKGKDIEKIYSFLTREVRKRSVKFQNGYYILPDAYKLYQENSFIPCSGRYNIVFD